MSAIFEHGYALIIGVDANQMPRLALPSVAKDVQAIYDVLVHPQRCAYNPENVRLIKGEKATSKEVLDGLYWLQEKVREDGKATAVLYYSGHGMVDKAADQYYLIPYDIRELSRLRADAIKAETFTAEISDIRAQRMLVVLDCCHAAGMDVKNVDLAALDTSRFQTAAFPLDLPETKSVPVFAAEPGAKNISHLLDGEGRAILNSSNNAQSSFVRNDGAMSLFTYHLIEALTGHAPHPDDASVVYVTDVMSWVTHQVKKSAREQGRDQTPVMRTSGVFPIAMLLGGQGVAKGIGQLPPNPLEPLPTPTLSTQVQQHGQTGAGDLNQISIGRDGTIEQIGDDNRIKLGDRGEYVGRDKVKKVKKSQKIGVQSKGNVKASRDLTGRDIVKTKVAGRDLYEVKGDQVVNHIYQSTAKPTKPRLAHEPELVEIPAGPFIMGAADDLLAAPLSAVDLPAYQIALYPVTNEQFAEFVQQTGRLVSSDLRWEGNRPPRERLRHPVTGVSWLEALAYCEWLSELTERPYTLPNEAQWEKAARGVDGRFYPWGNEWEDHRCNTDLEIETAVDAFPPQSPYGCYDMVGNGREWTTTLWGDSPREPDALYRYPWIADGRRDNLAAPPTTRRIFRGDRGEELTAYRCSARGHYAPNRSGPRQQRHGFRVVLAG